MPGSKILSAVLVMVPAAVLLTAQASFSEPAADACKPHPDAATPRGSHWYYRINHAKQRCWYLGPAGAHVTSKSLAESAGAATPPASNDDASAAPAAAPTPPDTARSEQPLLPAVAPAETPAAIASSPAPAPLGPGAAFASRWVDGLPKAEDVVERDPPPASSSYAEQQKSADISATAQQAPAKWPVAEADRTLQGATGDAVLRYFAMIGILLTALLLVAGWAAKYLRGPSAERLRERWRMMLRRTPAHAPLEVPATAGPTPAVRARRSGFRAPPRTPTDPADDLKASLAELMRDLRRAATVEEPVRYGPRPAYHVSDDAFAHTLEAAE